MDASWLRLQQNHLPMNHKGTPVIWLIQPGGAAWILSGSLAQKAGGLESG